MPADALFARELTSVVRVIDERFRRLSASQNTSEEATAWAEGVG
jgi:hypothetical protein